MWSCEFMHCFKFEGFGCPIPFIINNMEAWFKILLSLSACILIRLSFSFKKNTITTPPGPPHIPIITTFLWLRKSFSQLEAAVRKLHSQYGPIITLHIASQPTIFIADATLAHQALIQNASLFSHRPKARAALEILTNHQHNISSASYGATWRTLRRNLASVMLHPSRVKSFSETRKWVLHTLLARLRSDSEFNDNSSVKVIDHFQYAMFSLLVFMCFGERLDDGTVRDIERVQQQALMLFGRFNALNYWPRFTRLLLRKRWEEVFRIRKEQEDIMVPLIRARKQKRDSEAALNDDAVVCYVDTLLDLEWPEEKRKLNEGEMLTLCNEFMNAGTDSTSTSLQWIMAKLVKYPRVQERLVNEIRGIIGERQERVVKEEDLQKLPYLKAVILEGLRHHSPAHLVSHAVKEDVVLNDYLVPKNATVNFMVAMIGLDPKIWEDPMEFRPERFMNDDEFDITGSKEIKMIPFGAGRRICPAYNLALLHLEYFVANLIWNFQWKIPDRMDVDFSEKVELEFSGVMKFPLQVHISPRI